jgi:hypothetical protein
MVVLSSMCGCCGGQEHFKCGYFSYYAIYLCLDDSYVYLPYMFMKYYDMCGYALFMLS